MAALRDGLDGDADDAAAEARHPRHVPAGACGRPGPTCAWSAIAHTLRYVPAARGRRRGRHRELNAQKQAVETISPGEVLVIEARGEEGAGTIGDILALGRCAAVRPASSPTAACATARPSQSSSCRPTTGRRMPACSALHPLPARDERPGRLRRRARSAGRRDRRRRGGRLVIPAAARRGGRRGDALEQERQEQFGARARATPASRSAGVYPLSDARRAEYEAWLRSGAAERRPRRYRDLLYDRDRDR